MNDDGVAFIEQQTNGDEDEAEDCNGDFRIHNISLYFAAFKIFCHNSVETRRISLH